MILTTDSGRAFRLPIDARRFVTTMKPLADAGTVRRVVSRADDTTVEMPGLLLWGGVLLVAVLDVGLTYHGLTIGLVELNPLARDLLGRFGVWSLVGGKLLALGFAVIAWRALRQHRLLVPAVFLACWGAATLSNAVLVVNTV